MSMDVLMTIALVVLIIIGIIFIGVFLLAFYYGSKGNKKKKKKDENKKPEEFDNIDYPMFDAEERFHMAPLGDLDEEYMNLFSNPPMDKAARRGKSAYLREAYHERIRRIVNALNIEGVNISSYVDMVLTEHLMRYEDQIDKLIQNSNNNQGKKQWRVS